MHMRANVLVTSPIRISATKIVEASDYNRGSNCAQKGEDHGVQGTNLQAHGIWKRGLPWYAMDFYNPHHSTSRLLEPKWHNVQL